MPDRTWCVVGTWSDDEDDPTPLSIPMFAVPVPADQVLVDTTAVDYWKTESTLPADHEPVSVDEVFWWNENRGIAEQARAEELQRREGAERMIEEIEAEHLVQQQKWFEERLEDVGLLDRAMVVAGDLAVPVGGKRRGGFISGSWDPEWVKRIIAQLGADPEGFPRPHLERGGRRDTADTIRWGDAPPRSANPVSMGRYYGYSEEAIHEFTQRLRRVLADA